jgi:hypothetical protein
VRKKYAGDVEAAVRLPSGIAAGWFVLSPSAPPVKPDSRTQTFDLAADGLRETPV